MAPIIPFLHGQRSISPKQQRCKWLSQKRLFQRTSDLIRSLRKPSVTPARAKRLDTLGLGIQEVRKVHLKTKDVEVLLKILKIVASPLGRSLLSSSSLSQPVPLQTWLPLHSWHNWSRCFLSNYITHTLFLEHIMGLGP